MPFLADNNCGFIEVELQNFRSEARNNYRYATAATSSVHNNQVLPGARHTETVNALKQYNSHQRGGRVVRASISPSVNPGSIPLSSPARH